MENWITEFVNFTRRNNEEWEFRTRFRTDAVTVEIVMPFARTEEDDRPVWIQEREAMRLAHVAIAEWLASQRPPVEPIRRDT